MNAEPCPHEDELLEALGRRFVGAELEAHMAACLSCSELRRVAGALLDDRAAAIQEAPVPSAGTMWFRMQIRRRQEAHAMARRSLLAGQAVTLTVAAALLVLFLGADVAAGVREAIASIHLGTPMLFVIATGLLFAPIAGWVALRQK
jgi:predicted anti-sigma-YlaC factor YlaD